MNKLLLSLLFIALPAFADFVVPATPNAVNDHASVLSSATKESLAKELIMLKTATDVQAGIVIVDSLDGVSVEEASLKTATAWKLGSAKKDSGLLFFLAVKDRKIRIEVGYGLEGFVTDAAANRIIQSMKPYLKSGDYDHAFTTGVDTLSTTVREHYKEMTEKPVAAASTGIGWILFALMLSFAGVGVVMYVKRREKERLAEEAAEQTRKLFSQAKVRSEAYDNFKRSNYYSPRAAATPPSYSKPATRTEKKKESSTHVAVVPTYAPSYDDDSSRRSSSYSSESSSSSYSSSDYSGGGGDFGGGGSSDSY